MQIPDRDVLPLPKALGHSVAFTPPVDTSGGFLDSTFVRNLSAGGSRTHPPRYLHTNFNVNLDRQKELGRVFHGLINSIRHAVNVKTLSALLKAP
ncbi:hypothetical protein KQX54_005952 [Cotesia glomerata]|uniref:Uncharacterized protein n=1 Tax=Cotesia glomerata TaxID=32391 RepID=A0AAV7J4G4_COTGL|nr:hypothetical protein KQX54_005952 [Cotesia glomerata]